VDWYRRVAEGCRKVIEEYEKYAKRLDADPQVLETLRRRAEWCRRYVARQ
jgi:hypothetical protein